MSEVHPRFRHGDDGTTEPEWLGDPTWDDLPVVDVAGLARRHSHVVVVAAHPDDESLGVGGLLADLAYGGTSVVVVVATAGEGSHPAASAWAPELIAATRRAEVERAVAILAPGARVVHLGLPDGGVADNEGALTDALADLVQYDSLVLAPWTDDGHPDHDAAGRAAVAAATRATSDAAPGEAPTWVGRVLHYPVWLWHWARPSTFPWERALVVEPTLAALHSKRAAIAEHRSQTHPLGPLEGDLPVIGSQIVARAERVVEVLLDPAGPADTLSTRPTRRESDEARHESFDAMFDAGNDPWGFTSSWYEQRKRDLTLAALGRQRYGRVLEVGCSVGVLTRALAARAEHVLALDISARALQIAASGSPDNVEWVHGVAPHDLPTGSADLVVLSEIGYFLTGTELLATLRRVRDILSARGEVVLCHWRHPTSGVPLDGDLVHEQAVAALGMPVRATYADLDVRIDVLGEPVSLAATEGLT